METNSKTIASFGKKYNFLFDTSTILYFQDMFVYCGVSIFTVLKDCPKATFFITNNVLEELLRGPKRLKLNQIGFFVNHILNAELSMDRNIKENRFLIEENDEIKFIVLNKVSAIDYAQILMCQNHKELTLVSNDKKMLKSAAQVVKGRRVVGMPALLDRLLRTNPNNKKLKVLKETGDNLYRKIHAFGNLSEKDFNKKLKINN